MNRPRQANVTPEQRIKPTDIVKRLAQCLFGQNSLNVDNILRLWCKYPPNQKAGLIETFRFIFEKILYDDMDLIISTTSVELFKGAPTLNIPRSHMKGESVHIVDFMEN